MKISVIAFICLMANVVNALDLTADNYAAETEGKTVLIKFFAPWCGHCKKMKPTWDTLMGEFKDSKTQLVADVDCTSDGGKPLCDANGVKGYPTLKWGDPASLEDYSGGRDLKILRTFVEEKLKPICSPSNLDLCDDDKKAEIKKFMDMGEEALEKEVETKKAELDKTEEEFKEFVEGLQASYKESMDTKDAKIAEIKASGLSLMQSCLTTIKKGGHEEL